MTRSPALDLQTIRAAMRKEWDDAAVVARRRKWRPRIAAFGRGVTQTMLNAAHIRPGMNVLDIAAGLGDPAFSFAEAVGPTGTVMATDFSEPMIEELANVARELGIHNVSTRMADAQALPFGANSFDVVTCRWGIMYFPDPVAALREFLRVLRPGGRTVLMAWDSPKQVFFELTVDILKRHVQFPPPEPGLPTPFAFAEPGVMRRTLEQAGFSSIEEKHLPITATWDGPPAEHWQQFQDTAAPYRPMVDALTPEARTKVESEVIAAMSRYYDGSRIQYPLMQVLGIGVRS